jgi:hypothetical protein
MVRHSGLLLVMTVLMETVIAAAADDIDLVPLMATDDIGIGIALVVVFAELQFGKHLPWSFFATSIPRRIARLKTCELDIQLMERCLLRPLIQEGTLRQKQSSRLRACDDWWLNIGVSAAAMYYILFTWMLSLQEVILTKVFLSSTFTDLQSHRMAGKQALERLGSRVNRMEVFGARPDDATQASLKDLEECELFVGIYAHRYGSIPNGSATSITEQEYDHAKKLKKKCFAS